MWISPYITQIILLFACACSQYIIEHDRFDAMTSVFLMPCCNFFLQIQRKMRVGKTIDGRGICLLYKCENNASFMNNNQGK